MWDAIKRNPIRAFQGISATIGVVVNGLIVFGIVELTADQVAYLNGFMIALGAGWGIFGAPRQVASRANVEAVSQPVADELWDAGGPPPPPALA